jgi:hypothetical protein
MDALSEDVIKKIKRNGTKLLSQIYPLVKNRRGIKSLQYKDKSICGIN